ncbi:ParA family protein [Marinobacter sp. F3R08]|uniref:ParA family protein n=1 Tax=Marinobacter sp. F3R08 TaxID=2841559 RepID=UPI001C088593|nr:ParA family protein [Marinobacter sp. F3R08]MBU2952224.1 ParA family protein [Marinobacter sp. F3R08]
MSDIVTRKTKCPVISIANMKGGVGKSTIVIQATFAYSSDKYRFPDDKKILVVDMDPQGNSSTRLMRRTDLSQLEGTRTHELFNEDLETIKPVSTPCGADLIFSLQNDGSLDDIELRPMEVFLNPIKHIADLARSGRYAAIILDCPPSRSRKFTAALSCATDVIVPVEVSGFATDALSGIMESIEIAAEVNPVVQLTGVVINKFNSRSKRHKQERETLIRVLGDKVFDQPLVNRAPVDEANAEGIPVSKITSGAGRAAAKEVEIICNEIAQRCGIEILKGKKPKRSPASVKRD